MKGLDAAAFRQTDRDERYFGSKRVGRIFEIEYRVTTEELNAWNASFAAVLRWCSPVNCAGPTA